MTNSINIGTEIDLIDLLQSRLLIQANSGGGKSVLARVIIEETFGKVPFIVMDIEGEYYTLKEKFGDVLVIGGQHADIPISMHSAKLLPREIIGNRLSVVIDLSDLQMSDRILYAKHFLETMMDLPKEYWISYFVFIEEAHKLCGEQDKQASATAVKDLMSRGRKRGYCGVLLTQRISKLHKDAAAECNNKFIGRTFLDIDLDRSAKELGFATGAKKEGIRSLAPGHFYAFGTSIKPHEVHAVMIRAPKTKIPKAGVSLDIKPQKPTEKIMAMLTKLNEQLQQSAPGKKPPVPVAGSRSDGKIEAENQYLKRQLEESEMRVQQLSGYIKQYDVQIKSIRDIIDKTAVTLLQNIPEIGSSQKPGKIQGDVIKEPHHGINRPSSGIKAGQGVHNSPKSEIITDPSTFNPGKCERAILQFLATYPKRTFTNAQVAIATGYSSTSGGFLNALSKLTTNGLINRGNGQLSIKSDVDVKRWIGNYEIKSYSIEAYMDKLGKCEREIYRVVLDHPKQVFTNEQVAGMTETGYSYTSGGFLNAISRLKTLELIVRDRGTVRLNPELLEL